MYNCVTVWHMRVSLKFLKSQLPLNLHCKMTIARILKICPVYSCVTVWHMRVSLEFLKSQLPLNLLCKLTIVGF